ncbi:MAG: flippase-like domain-containing protein [Acidobacteria bacterium]|nr:flippase-like domain-containing protein [Acidobacteriota bacterium]
MTTLPSRRTRVHATWSAVFGVVPDKGLHRRPTEVLRILGGLALLALGALNATRVGPLEQSVHDAVGHLPDPLLTGLRWINTTGAVIAIAIVLIVALISRRPRFIASVVLAGAAALVVGRVLDSLIGAPTDGGHPLPGYPPFPSLRLAVVAAVFFAATPELTRPARRLLTLLLGVIGVSLIAVTGGYPTGILGAIGLAWTLAAIVHLVLGSPDGAPSTAAVAEDLRSLGIDTNDLRAAEDQLWGETAFIGTDADGPIRVAVIGRDATNAQFLTKLVRFIWMKDSGPGIAATREQQIEHRAYLLMRAERGGVPAPTVIDSGAVGSRGDVVLVLRDTNGVRLDDTDEGARTDAFLDAAWRSLERLHRVGIAHGSISARTLRLAQDGTVAFTDLATADARPSPDALRLDHVALLVTLADLTSAERAVASARRALDTDALIAVQPLLEATALPRVTRRSITDAKHLTAEVGQQVASVTGVTPEKLTELRRVTPANILLAAATVLGFYLLLGQLTKIDFATTFDQAEWGWVVVVAILAQLPLFGTAMALLGAVSRPLPLRPVFILQFANKFTGLVGGGVATMAMLVRFFQKQGFSPAVAVSSSLMTSFASGIVQFVLVGLGLLLGDATIHLSHSGGGSSGLTEKLAIALAAVLLVAIVLALIPRFRHRLLGLIGPHLVAARTNFTTVVSEPRKAVQLFAGNFISQFCYALVLWAALHTYGESLGILQLIVINSIASIIGGIAPVPGGMGVIEAGLIAGFTAAGVPDQAAIAATFTARTFTAYLPPAWGWLAMEWMHRNDYI